MFSKEVKINRTIQNVIWCAIAVFAIITFNGCATHGATLFREVPTEYQFKLDSLNFYVDENETLHITGRIIDDKGSPVAGKLIVFLPRIGEGLSIRKLEFGFVTKSNIANPSGETDSAGQFNIRVDLNSDFMKEMGNEFVLCVVSNKTLAFIGQNSYLFGSIPLGLIGSIPLEVSRGKISELMKSISRSLKAIGYHAGYKTCAGEERDFKGKVSFVFEENRKNILKFEKKENK
jgi:hypothetical protein